MNRSSYIHTSLKQTNSFNHLHNYFNIHVCLASVGVRRRPSASVGVPSRPTSDFYNVQSSRSPVRPLLNKAKPSYVYSILKPHGQSSRSPVGPLLSKAKPSYVYSTLKLPGQSSRSPVRPLLSKPKQSHVYSILKQLGQSSRSPV